MATTIPVKCNFRKSKDDAGNEIPAIDPVTFNFHALDAGDVIQLMFKDKVDEATMDQLKGLFIVPPVPEGQKAPEPTEQDKVVGMILTAVNSVTLDHVKKVVFDDVDLNVVRQTKELDPTLYDFTMIALLPPSRRGAVGIEDEMWDDFVADYVEVIQHHGMDEKRAKVGADIMKNRLNKVKSNKQALEQFKVRIQTWYSNSSRAEALTPVYTYLIDRVEKLIATNEPLTVLQSF